MFRRARGLEETDTPLLKGMHKTSHVPSASAERNLGQTYLLILESHPERQAATGTHPGDGDAVADIFESSSSSTGKQHFEIIPLAY